MKDEEWIQRAWPVEETIPFSRFMDLCLYHPQLGYYERDTAQIGPQGDFVTRVSGNPLFGQLLAFQLAAWLQNSHPPQVALIEAGAHDGTLARDILKWFQIHRPELSAQITYLILEPSPRRQEVQRAQLNEFAGQVRWQADFAQLGVVNGIFFSNELLDAFPVRRLGWNQARRCWFEWGVSHRDGQLQWTPMNIEAVEAADLLSQAGLASLGSSDLPEHHTVDLCPAAANWWAQAARSLHTGRLLTIDYGFVAEELLLRSSGTLRAYRRHHVFSDLLNEPGQGDLTAHVNFTQLARTGEDAGLVTEGLWPQDRFFSRIVAQVTAEEPRWLATQTRELQRLLHPDAFRVLVQERPAASSR